MNAAVSNRSLIMFTLAASLMPNLVSAFNSGSTGADGAFSPTTNTEVQLPPNGVFNFTTVNIPAGVTVKFKKNATNTPVVILASGDVTIAGAINVAGGSSPAVGAAGDGNLADDGLPGRGGPGGYDGGYGAAPGYDQRGGNGLGPGGGAGAKDFFVSGNGWYITGGGGGGYAKAGGDAKYAPAYHPGVGGVAYGASTLLPLLGGSGGGGGGGGTTFAGSGGGGGGGAILIASSGKVTVTAVGYINAYGGNSGASSGVGCGGVGGSGSGGAIRIVATTIAGDGAIAAGGGTLGAAACSYLAGAGEEGRIRLEAEYFQRTTGTTPAYSIGAPGTVFVPGLPAIAVSSVAGVAVPAEPTGNADVTLPSNLANPVTVTFSTKGVPLGSTITLTVTPKRGAPIIVTSTALSGTVENATASATVSLPSGPSTLSATTSYSITTAAGDALSMFAQGERVKRVELAASTGTPSMVTLVTVSGKKFTMPSVVAANYISG